MQNSPSRIAIVGLWCRFPGSDSPAAFWRNLLERRVTIRRISPEALLASGVNAALIADPAYVPFRGILDDALRFDPTHFGMSPAEAALTDPQHRQFLECVRLAQQEAGFADSAFERAGVFAAQSRNDYRESCILTGSPIAEFNADVLNGAAHLATGVAYRLGAEGPAITVQSACSSSLVAVHLACQALSAGDCDLAIAGGVSIGWPQEVGHAYVQDGIMSRDGQCRPFDVGATGTVRGEGVGVLLLQREEDALSAGSDIYAFIRGSAVNNDGCRRMGFSTPSSDGQSRVIRHALARAGIAPDDVTYLETHGTGTAVGDAIELAAVAQALQLSNREQGLVIGSTKANIGHLDAAAGVAGLIRTVLQLRHRVLLPQAAFERLHDEIGLISDRFTLLQEAMPWTAEGPRFAGVSSFGLGGTNAHVVVEGYAGISSRECDAPLVLPLSGGDESAMRGAFEALRERADRHGLRTSDVAWTLASRHQQATGQRLAMVGDPHDNLAGFAEVSSTLMAPTELGDQRLRLVLGEAVNGECEPWHIRLSRQLPIFRRQLVSTVTLVDRSIAPSLGADPCALPAEPRLANLCLQVAVARTLATLGMKRLDVVALPASEVAAACIAGAINLQEATDLLRARSPDERLDMLDAASTDSGHWYSIELGRVAGVADLLRPTLWRAEQATSASPHAVPDSCALAVVVGQVLQGSAATNGAQHVIRIDDVGETPANWATIVGLAWCIGEAIAWQLVYEAHAPRDVADRLFGESRAIFVPPGINPKPSLGFTAAKLAPAQPPMLPSQATLEELVRTAFSSVLQRSDVDSDANFFNLGGCSLTALDVLEQVNDATGARVSLRKFLHEPTVHALTLQLLESVKQADEDAANAQQPTQACTLSPTIGSAAVVVTVPPDQSMGCSTHSDDRGPSFSVFFFSGETAASPQEDLYGLVLDAARLADECGFEAIWVPERHFHRFGGLFPAPAVLAAAIAVSTQRVGIRAGSIVLPIHNPIEVVEQWSVVDNLSGGRVGLAFAPGFHPTDFLLAPDRFANRRAHLDSGLALFQSLWQSGTYTGPDGLGTLTKVSVLPRPLQAQLPIWITAADSPDSFVQAGARGANVLTAMLSLDISGLSDRIKRYREALAGRPGRVTVMLHTYVHPDPSVVAAIGIRALHAYLTAHLDFASARASYEKVRKLSIADRNALVDRSVSRYLDGASLIGTPAQCEEFARRLSKAGVDEIACLVDFGVPRDKVLPSLREVSALQARMRNAP